MKNALETISSAALDHVTGGALWMRGRDGRLHKVRNSDVPPGAMDLIATMRKLFPGAKK